MAHASIRLRPGVDTNATPALNEAGISASQLIRFMYDRTLGALVQKRGGWSRWATNTTPAIVRALWAWEDTQAVTHLAYGTQNIGTSHIAQLGVITNGSPLNITPRYVVHSTDVPVITTVAGSSIVTITDTTATNITQYDSVYITTQIAVGGLILFGSYPCNPDGHFASTTYTIQATDILGNPLPALSSSSSPVLPAFTTVSAAPQVTVNLPNHGYSAAASFPVLISTTVGGTTFLGNSPILSITDANNFVITAPTTPTSSATASLNNGHAYYIYSYGGGSSLPGSGYGVGGYGRGGYGTGSSDFEPGAAIPAYDWTLDNWGEILIAVGLNTEFTAPSYQPIYQWGAESATPVAYAIPEAPMVNDGAFVAMPQRQIVAWGSTFTGIQDPLLIRWCDVNNFNVWAATVTNQAGSYRLPKGSKIVGALQGPQQGLVWTDLGLWSMQYIGLPYVYSFNELATGCGLIARKAAAVIGGVVYWMGPSQFYMYDAESVQPVACPLWDVIFQDLDQTNLSKIRVAVNSRFGEIEWFFPTIGSGGEVNASIKYNVFLQAWDFNSLSRSAWIDQSVLGPPIGADPNSLYLYQHETSPDADGQAMVSNFTTGYYAMNEGDDITYVDQVWPDFKYGPYGGMQSATINLTFNVASYPEQIPQTYGPYVLTQASTYISPRFRGRLVSLTIGSSDTGSFWRCGNLRYRLSPDGRF